LFISGREGSHIETLHVVLLSGGLSSAFTLERVIKEYGRENTVAFHTDTRWEDEDNYRFMGEIASHFNAKLENRMDGRIPPEVWFKERYLVGKNLAKCSLALKTKQTQKYISELQAQDIEPILYFGIGKHEEHRAVNLDYRYCPIECRFPMVDNPLSNDQMKLICESQWGIKIPRMYRFGFSHSNCGGRCIKGGLGHFARLLDIWPDRYAEVEQYEREFRKTINPDIAILKDRRGGQTKYMTLECYRQRLTTGTIFEEKDEDLTPCECAC